VRLRPGDLRVLSIPLGGSCHSEDLIEVVVCERWCVDVLPDRHGTRIGIHCSPDADVRQLWDAGGEA